MAENDINVPPAQESPKNIVNILNDDCLQLILLKLDKVCDFWRAAKVCTRFQENAKICYPFKRLSFSAEIWKGYTLFEHMEGILKLFGHRIKSISCISHSRNKILNHNEHFALISKYCRKTLTELELRTCDTIYDFKLPFEALEKLNMHRCSFILRTEASFIFPNLRYLKFHYSQCDKNVQWLVNHFPKLQEFYFDLLSISDDKFAEFQNHNPQLKSLRFYIYRVYFKDRNKLPLIWKNIENRLPNIENLFLRINTPISKEEFIHVSNLRCLKKFRLVNYFMKNEPDFDLENVKLLFSSFVQKNQPIEELNIDFMDKKLGEIISNLKTIKSFYVGNDPDNVLSDVAKNLPNLEYCIDYGPCCPPPDATTNLWKANNILKHCEKLIELDTLIYLNEFLSNIIDLNDFKIVLNSIVALATAKRVKVTIFYKERALKKYNQHILHHILKTVQEWVHFVNDEDFLYAYRIGSESGRRKWVAYT